MLAHCPDEQRREYDGSQNHPSCVRPRIAGIEMPEAIAKFPGLAGDTIHEPIDALLIDGAPEEIRGDPHERPHDKEGVEFVNEILSRQQPVRRTQTLGEVLGCFRPAYVE